MKTETRVKALEWELLGDDSWRAPALFFGSFRVENYARGYIVLWSVPGIADTFVEGRWPSAEAAKAAAQADYERGIRSALEAPTPQEAPSEVTDEMVERAIASLGADSNVTTHLAMRDALSAALKGDRP